MLLNHLQPGGNIAAQRHSTCGASKAAGRRHAGGGGALNCCVAMCGHMSIPMELSTVDTATTQQRGKGFEWASS